MYILIYLFNINICNFPLQYWLSCIFFEIYSKYHFEIFILYYKIGCVQISVNTKYQNEAMNNLLNGRVIAQKQKPSLAFFYENKEGYAE